MNGFLRHPLAGLAASAMLLTSILGYMVVDRVMLLKNGREIVLPIRPVDPRDLFKGDYARLGYDISQYDEKLDATALPDDGRQHTVFVTIEQDAGGTWKVVAIANGYPASVAGNQIVLRGRANRSTASRWNFISYGLERYYLPEGTGKSIEDLARKSQLSAIVAVDSKGKAAIKGLVVDGKRVYDEPRL